MRSVVCPLYWMYGSTALGTPCLSGGSPGLMAAPFPTSRVSTTFKAGNSLSLRHRLVNQILDASPKHKNSIKAAVCSDTLSEFPHRPISGQSGFGVWLLWFPFYDLIHLWSLQSLHYFNRSKDLNVH